jgi:class 3 adenylate cyclase
MTGRAVTAASRGPGDTAHLAAQLDALREVLHAISVSPFDLEGVLGIVVERMSKLCDADMGIIYLPAGENLYRAVAAYATNPEHTEYERTHPTPVVPGTMVGRVVLSGEPNQFVDAETDPSYTWKEGRRIGGFRTIAGVPIRKEGQLIGVVGLARLVVRAFSDAELALVETFADQAAIVIDNVRLVSTIQRQREELARYLPSTVAELISSPDGEQLLAGHRREVSAVFADLRGFTNFAESAEPEEMLDVLREYHREMGAVIVAHHGTLEHFAGDGMMIFLNDPELVPDHPIEAIRMAVEMRDHFGALAERWRRRGFDLGLGIGVSVGYATLGRIGFEGHLGYAILGSVANLAARLCAVAESGQIILSERIYSRVESLVTATSLGQLELKGFRRPVDAYALVDLVGQGS